MQLNMSQSVSSEIQNLVYTNSHFLSLAHAVHVGAVGRGSFLVDIVVVSEGGANDFGVLFVVS